jgi:putative Mn2+ efflux pump MntP
MIDPSPETPWWVVGSIFAVLGWLFIRGVQAFRKIMQEEEKHNVDWKRHTKVCVFLPLESLCVGLAYDLDCRGFRLG